MRSAVCAAVLPALIAGTPSLFQPKPAPTPRASAANRGNASGLEERAHHPRASPRPTPPPRALRGASAAKARSFLGRSPRGFFWLPLARLRQPQDDVAVALARAAHGA